MDREKQSRWALPGLVVLGLGLRLYGAARAGLTFDESIVWAFAREITVAPLHLVSRTADHPLLNAYLVRASSLAFGESDLGLRVLHACLGAATIVVVFHLARRFWGFRAGLVAAGLLAVDPFHVSWSRLIIEEIPLLLWESLALLFVWRGVSGGRAADFVRAGIGVGLAYLAKETALLLVPALAVAVLLDGRGRRALRTTGPWLGLAAALLFVGLDLAWTLGREGHWQRTPGILGQPLGLTLKGTSLYLGEVYRPIFGLHVLDADYAQGSAYATAWPLGILYLAGVVAAVRRRHDPDRLLLVVFLFVFVAATLVDGRRVFDPFWWGSLSFIPALLLLARMLDAWCARVPAASKMLIAAAVALALYDASWLGQQGMRAPRLTREEWAARIAADAEARLSRGDLETAREQAAQALLLDADNASARAVLARIP